MLVNAILRVVHPELYFMARGAMEKLHEEAELTELLEIWASVFNGCQILSNRETPLHRDNNSCWEWYDLLCSIGPYADASFELPGVGLRFPYDTGVIVAICGRILRHGVSVANGDRICIAYYMRENVQRRLSSQLATWNHRLNYV